jgi:hypothetical protein
MNIKTILGVCLVLPLVLAPLRAEDYLKEAQNENSPLIQTSSDQRIKVTLLYVGPMKRKLLDYVYVITYLVEDLGPEDEYERHVAAEHAPPNRVSRYDLFGAGMEVKDGSHQLVEHPGGNTYTYKEALASADFKADYPGLTLPDVAHPARARVSQCFYKRILTGPLDITLHDWIQAYGPNSFRFHDIDVASFSSP